MSALWLYSGLVTVLILIEIFALEIADVWQDQRRILVKNRRSAYEARKSKRARFELATAARAERQLSEAKNRKEGAAYKAWLKLGSRGLWQKIAESRRAKIARNERYTLEVAWLFIQIAGICGLGLLYFMSKAFVVKQARSDGVGDFVGVYAAVTGKLPLQFSDEVISRERLLSLACPNKSDLWQYRTVTLEDSMLKGATHAPLVDRNS